MRLVTSLSKLFGKRLRELRVEKGFNQLYLATLASVSEDFISLVERGIKTPSFETIEALAAALETTVTVLFTFPGEEGERQRVRMVRPNEQSKKTEPAKKGSTAKVVKRPRKAAR